MIKGEGKQNVEKPSQRIERTYSNYLWINSVICVFALILIECCL